jgi:hypothetical protein
MFRLRPWQKRLLVGCAVPAAILAAYVGMICWRVGFAEEVEFGRSYLVPFAFTHRAFVNPPVSESYGQMTYEYMRDSKKIVVYKQLINGLQHTYGSALAAFELGELPADLLFRANEYMEGYLQKDGATASHHFDTRKDLANNAVGRGIGIEARRRGLHGRDAEQFILARTMRDIEQGIVINNFLDPRVSSLPTLEAYGCPFLPKPSREEFQQFQVACAVLQARKL